MTQHHTALAFARTAVCIAVALATAPALAQNTSSAIGGRITAADGSPVAGAVVTIVHIESGTSNRVTTDAEGRYTARGLRVGGPYSVTISKDAATQRREDIYLPLAETLALDVALAGAGAVTSLGAVSVTGAVVNDKFSSTAMGAGTQISNRELNAYASVQRNLQDYARLDPRVSQTDKERGEISVAGQNSRFNSITIDGVRTNDTFGLEANNLPTAKQPISIDAIESVQINVSNYDVTQQGYTGANINAVTKSGTNEFKGSVYYVFRDDKLVGKRFNRTNGTYADAPAFEESTKGFTLGGPIIKDKLFFFASYEELKSTRNAPDFGPIGDPKTNVAITPAAITAAADIARATYGFDAGSFAIPQGSELLVKDTLLKLDWNVSERHRVNLRYAKTEQSEPIYPGISASALSLSSYWFSQGKTLETTVGQWFADWTDNFSTELKLSRRDYESVPANNADRPAIGLNFTNALQPGLPASTPTSRFLNFGTENSRHFNELRTKTSDAYLAGNLILGAHELKFGGDFSRNEIFNAFLQNTKGNYTFSCINSSDTFRYTFGTINCGTATAAQVEQAVLENFRRGRPFTYQVQLPVAGRTLNDGAANWSLDNTGVFLQDTFELNKNLSFLAGVRVDQISTKDRPAANAAAAAPTVAGVASTTTPGTGTRQSGGFGLDNTATLDGEQLVQPRFGFNWNLDPANKRKMQVRGGFGLFQGAAASVWLSNPYSNTGVTTRVVGCGGSFPTCPVADNTFNADPNNQPSSFPGTPPAANVDFVDGNMGQPSVWKLNLALDAELPWYGLIGGVEWLHTKTKQGIYYKQLNLGTVTRTGTDGRELYYNANGYNTNCWTALGATNAGGAGCGGSVTNRALSNASFNNVLYATKTTQGGGDSYTFSLSQQPTRDFGWTVAYTRATSKEVSPLTSSTSNSNWGGRSIFNPNEEVSANSAYLVRDRVGAAINWSKAFYANYRTTFGLFYEGRKGKPYSWTFNNDLNGDGQGGNDLMYIPTAPGSGEVLFAGGAADEARFWDFVNSDKELSKSRGGLTKRNGSFSPFVNNFDLRLSQEVPGFFGKQKGVFTFDILNVGNLINKKWGRIDETAFQAAGGAARSFVNYKGIDPATGKYIYSTMPAIEDLTTRQAKGESQWAVQVTVRYEF